MDTPRSILRSARSFFAGTALSRISGLFRDIAMASAFGSSAEIGSFMIAYRLANLFRRLLGEGNLQAGFIPQFASLPSEEKGKFFRDASYSIGAVLIGAILVLEFFFAGCRRIANPNWTEILNLTIRMVPSLFFICLASLNSSVLQDRKKYFLPAAAPIAFNFIWIVAIWICPDVYFLSFAVNLAFAAQWIGTVFEGGALLTFREWIRPRWFSNDVRKLVKPLLLGIAGVGAVQFNSALDPIFARIADLRGPAFLWYAIRIQQLPLALFGIALSGALLPPLSRIKDPVQKRMFLSLALKQSASLMLICTFGLFLFGESGINLLFGHGKLSLIDIRETARCLYGYAFGLVPSVFILILSAHFYSDKNYRTPAAASFYSVLINIALNGFFVLGFGWGPPSVAIATSLSAFCNLFFLSSNLFDRSFWWFFLKTGAGTALAAAAVYPFESLWTETGKGTFFFEFCRLSILSLMYFGLLAGFFRVLGFKKIDFFPE